MFQRPQSTLALRARALLLLFEKFTRAYLFQIALEIMWLPTHTAWGQRRTLKIRTLDQIRFSQFNTIPCTNLFYENPN